MSANASVHGAHAKNNLLEKKDKRVEDTVGAANAKEASQNGAAEPA
jgi:hypothetical protein